MYNLWVLRLNLCGRHFLRDYNLGNEDGRYGHGGKTKRCSGRFGYVWKYKDMDRSQYELCGTLTYFFLFGSSDHGHGSLKKNIFLCQAALYRSRSDVFSPWRDPQSSLCFGSLSWLSSSTFFLPSSNPPSVLVHLSHSTRPHFAAGDGRFVLFQLFAIARDATEARKKYS